MGGTATDALAAAVAVVKLERFNDLWRRRVLAPTKCGRRGAVVPWRTM